MKTTKKLLSLILAVVILVTIFVVPAYAYTTTNQTGGTHGTWNYVLINGYAYDVYCTSSLSGAVTIPSKLDGYPVASIGDLYMKNMFNTTSNSTITSVTIPNSVTHIGDYAFYQCTGLKSITIPNSVNNMGGCVFQFCTSLTSITMPSTAYSSAPSTFDTIPFVVMSSDKTVLYHVPYTYTSYTIPSTVTTIAMDAFASSRITSLTIPNSVTYIGGGAFRGSKLTSITIPSSVTSLRNATFMYCRDLASITICGPIEFVDSVVFYDCRSLTSIVIPNSVERIFAGAFEECTNLTSITIPDSVIYIANNAFYNCPGSSTGQIVIPKNITYIGPNAFYKTQGVYYYSSNPVAQAASEAYAGTPYAWTDLDGTTSPVITIAPYDTNPTNQNITVTATTNKGTLNATSHTFTENGSFEFVATDTSGNVTRQTVTITNIDKTAPNAPTATANITTPTNTNVTVTATFSTDSVVKQYNKDNGTWTNYTAPITFASNGNVRFRGQDAAGNWSNTTTYTISNIDKIAPVITIAPYNTNPTNQDIVVNATVDKGTLNATNHTFSENGSFELIATDNAGNVSTKTVTITNIDKVAPSPPIVTIEDGKYLIVKGSIDAEFWVEEYMCQITRDDGWIRIEGDILSNGFVASDLGPTDIVFSIELEPGTYEIYATATDIAGNIGEQWLSNVTLTGDISQTKEEIATQAVEKAEETHSQDDVDDARDAIDDLDDGATKDELTDRLDTAQEAIDEANALQEQIEETTQTVEQAETSKKQEDIDSARDSANNLPDCPEKTDLIDRVNKIISKETLVVIQAVEKAEKYPTNRNYIVDAFKKAEALLDTVPQKADIVARATALKEAYNNYVNELQYANNVNNATHYVTQAEKSPANYNINKAQEYIDQLREDDPVRTELQARLDAVKDKIALEKLTKEIQSATKAVANAEKYRKASYFNKAQTLVTALPDIEEKQTLQDRLDVIILK